MDPARVARVRDLCRRWVDCGDTPSLQVLVARRGVVVLHEAFGVLRPGADAPPLARDSIFPIASAGKTVTAAAVMSLVEDGLIGLNRPWIDYLPEYDLPGIDGLADSQVADLLCHTSGLDDIDLVAFAAKAAANRQGSLPPPAPGQHPRLANLIGLLAGAPLTRKPGAAMVYSNLGYLLLGEIVRRVSGQPFSQVVRDRILDPLGMRDSHLPLPRELRATRRVFREPDAPGSEPLGTFWDGIDSELIDDFVGGFAPLASTAWDLGLFAQMLLNRGRAGTRQVLSSATVAAMSRSQLPAGIPQLYTLVNPATGERLEYTTTGGGYGYGLFVFAADHRSPLNGSLISSSGFGHSGHGGSAFWVDPEADLVGIYLSVSPRWTRSAFLFNVDLFENAVHAAIVD